MYRLLIVDDEELEREGMAEFIPWEEYGIQLADTAWNGVEGLEKIKKYRPDIVITDIKMPVMDGIELIRRAKHLYPDIVFIVLSGYGEYEYTSQAMEEGVRHYILKPCDEEKIAGILEKVKQSIAEQARQKEQMAQYSSTIRTLLPRAKEQVFYNLLMGREQIQADYRLFMEELDKELPICILSIQMEREIDYIVQFALHNILGELFGQDSLILETAFANEMVFLIRAQDAAKIQSVIRRMGMELERLADRTMRAALSAVGSLEEIRALYLQTVELFLMGSSGDKENLLTYEVFRESKSEIGSLIDYAALCKAKDLEEILMELYLASCKMKIMGFSDEKKCGMYRWIRKVFSNGEAVLSVDDKNNGEVSEWELLRDTAWFVAGQNRQGEDRTEEEKRLDKIIETVFEHLSDKEMNIRYLAREVLFMNEDYFGRLFQRYKNMKFSAYLLQVRIEMAARIMKYHPDIRVADVAEMVGFPGDGQYFSKVFRKATGMTPSQYRETEGECKSVFFK